MNPSDIHQMMDASRTLVPLDKGATGGSASMIPDSTAPPKQKSMELNQQANGLTLETSRAPAQVPKSIYMSRRNAYMTCVDVNSCTTTMHRGNCAL